MHFNEFERKVRAINPKLMIAKFNGPVWGIHLRMPRHPDANDHGLVHICSMQSGKHYGTALRAKSGSDSFGMFMRGWHIVLRLLVDKHLLSASKVCSSFGRAWRTS